MKKVIEAVLEKSKFILTAQAVVLIGIAVVAPFFHFQWITGPIVNATLFVSVILLGVQGATLVALLPSIIALSVGTLPAVLAPMVPYIMLSNIILILAFNLLRKKNFIAAVISASVLKFGVLFSTSFIVINLVMKKELAASIASVMGINQLITALLGGAIAWMVVRRIKE